MAHCGECKLDFSKNSNLRAHVKRKHPDKLDVLAPISKNPSGSGSFRCMECNKCFLSFGALKFHVKQKHPDKVEELQAPSAKKSYECNQCDCQFSMLKELDCHKKTHHNLIKTIHCTLCQYTGASADILINHYTQDHCIQIENDTFEFNSVKAFQVWKTNIEAETFASFVQKTGAIKTSEHTKTKYFCHRSGKSRTRGKNIRKPKMQGSNKIGGYCPAKMTVITKNNKCTVQFCKTHVGHDQQTDLGHLFLTASQRDNIASKIAANIPMQFILDEIKDSVKDSNLSRLHLLTKKDLYNIENSFNIRGSSVRHANDAVSVEAWVDESRASDSVCFYKPQDSLCEEHSELGLVKALSTPKPVGNVEQSLDERKGKLLQIVQEELLNVTTIEQMEAAERIIAPLKPTLAAVVNLQQSSTNLSMPSTSNTSHSRKIQPQRRLFAKKQSRKKKIALKKPSAEDADGVSSTAVA